MLFMITGKGSRVQSVWGASFSSFEHFHKHLHFSSKISIIDKNKLKKSRQKFEIQTKVPVNREYCTIPIVFIIDAVTTDEHAHENYDQEK